MLYNIINIVNKINIINIINTDNLTAVEKLNKNHISFTMKCFGGGSWDVK